jgi:hypothetical protein
LGIGTLNLGLAYGRSLSPELLPIGYDPGTSSLCLAISAENYGKVYFWSGVDDQSYFVANSFTEFLNMLYAFSDEPPPAG